jgi:hypothetical protein
MEANDLLSSQQSQLNELLIKNKELFVTKENPKLGLTNLVEHQIHLKPDAVSKHQRPYKLPPHKRAKGNPLNLNVLKSPNAHLKKT